MQIKLFKDHPAQRCSLVLIPDLCTLTYLEEQPGQEVFGLFFDYLFILARIDFILKRNNPTGSHWRSSHYAVTHVRNKNSITQGRSPYVVIVIFNTIRNCS